MTDDTNTPAPEVAEPVDDALAHGGEEQAGRVILPTARNIKLLQPWVHLIVAVSGEVVLHENHT